MIATMWEGLKVWRKVRLGPIAFIFSFRRATRITRGTSRDRRSEGSVYTSGGRRDYDNAFTQPSDSQSFSTKPSMGTAVIVGVGPGFGYALAHTLAESGFDLALVSRDANRLAPLCRDLREHDIAAESYGADVTHETDVQSVFDRIVALHGCPALVVYSLQEYGPGDTLEVSMPAFESAWRHNCLGAFLVSQSAGRIMKPQASGSIFFIGSTSSVLGRAGHLNLAVGKFGQRALAQVLAREMWPSGIHVAHVLIDADIAESSPGSTADPQADPKDIAVSILALHKQPRTAWSSEIDLRPWNEAFWEHC